MCEYVIKIMLNSISLYDNRQIDQVFTFESDRYETCG